MDSRSGYEAMSDLQLRELAMKYRLPPAKRVDGRGERVYFDRQYVVDYLVKREASRMPARGLGSVDLDTLASENNGPQKVKSPKLGGRLPNKVRTDSIRSAISKHGDNWRDHLPEIFKELDSKEGSLGTLFGGRICIDDGKSITVAKWEDFDLAQGEDRERIIDVLRKYRERRI